MAKLFAIAFMLFSLIALICAQTERKCTCTGGEEYSNDYTYGNNNGYGSYGYGNNGYGNNAYGNNGYGGVNNYGYGGSQSSPGYSRPTYVYGHQRPVYGYGNNRNYGTSYRYGRNQAYTQENGSEDYSSRSNDATNNSRYTAADKSTNSSS